MSPLYLSRIELTDFRSFARLNIALPPKPGVLIVHGTNGLGKSSLFDALEWTLTGGIDHFRNADGYSKVGSYLSRWRETLGPTAAAIAFSDGSRIQREITSAKATTSTLSGDVSDITAFLRAPDWTQPITALSRYFLLTHFLGQSVVSRLFLRPPNERFEILKEASRTADLEAFGIALHGKGSNRVARAFIKRISELEEVADHLCKLLALEAQLWAGAQASGALDDQKAADLARSIVDALARAAVTPPLDDDHLPSSAIDDPTIYQVAIDALRADHRERELSITQGAQLLERQQRYTANHLQAAAASHEGQERLSDIRAEALRAVEAATQIAADTNTALANLTTAKDHHFRLVELLQSRSALDVARSSHQAAQDAAGRAHKALAEAESQFVIAERRSQVAARLLVDVEAINASIDEKRNSSRNLDKWLERSDRISLLRAAVVALEAKNPALDDEVGKAEQTVDTTKDVSRAEAAKLNAMKASVSELSSAVATIAGNLPAGGCECPACGTQFPNPDSLAARVHSAAERLAPLVIDQQATSARAQADLEAAVARLESLQETLNQLRHHRAEIQVEQIEQERLQSRFGDSFLATRTGAEEQQNRLRRDIDALLTRRARRSRWIDVLAPGDVSLASIRSEAMRRLGDASRAVDIAARVLDDLSVREATATADAEARALALFPQGSAPGEKELNALIDRALRDAEATQAIWDQLRGQQSLLEAEAASLISSQAEAKVRTDEAADRAKQAKASLDALSVLWVQAGWTTNGVAQTVLDTANADLAAARSALAEASDWLKRLREGREARIRQQVYRDAFDSLLLEVDVAPNSSREIVLAAAQDRLAATESLARETQEAKAIASASSMDIAKEVEEFSADYLKPLDTLSNAINQAILCDPRVGIGFRVNKKKIEQSALLVGEMPESVGKIDPVLVHSEGQMAALAVSMLCAASLTYPWSRWRALVLDDPLQHNDAIHAAAFADFIGSLVTHKNYQVLLSTHDLGQSEFLTRKFEARQIPCAVLNLLGRGKNGVEWNFRPAKAGATLGVTSLSA